MARMSVDVPRTEETAGGGEEGSVEDGEASTGEAGGLDTKASNIDVSFSNLDPNDSNPDTTNSRRADTAPDVASPSACGEEEEELVDPPAGVQSSCLPRETKDVLPVPAPLTITEGAGAPWEDLTFFNLLRSTDLQCSSYSSHLRASHPEQTVQGADLEHDLQRLQSE